jgi:putative glutathione S-transferase
MVGERSLIVARLAFGGGAVYHRVTTRLRMGLLIDGVWSDDSRDTTRMQSGRFVRPQTRFRNWVTPDGSPGPTGEGGFPAERGRYHLYVALSCPWAHRTVIFRALKKLEDVISMSVVEPIPRNHGWEFVTPDSVNHKPNLAEIYVLADAKFTGRVTVPVLWDKARCTIVNNESAEIIRMLNAAFAAFTPVKTDYYPPHLRAEIDSINTRIYENVNNGVYRAGFATAQEAYDEAFRGVFGLLDEIEQRLAGQRYLAGSRLTEADWRLFTTLIRFDAVYYGHFKCNLRRIVDYPNLSNYLRDLYQVPGVAETVNMDHIKRHYYGSQRKVNPTGIVPLGPLLDFDAPHDRGRIAG